MISEIISNLELSEIRDAVEANKRLDGRKNDEFRDIKIETGVIAKAEGSAVVTMGKSKVIAGVKISVGTPFNDRPNEGVLMVNAELSPMAHNTFEAGRPGEVAVELARVVDRSIREAGVMDTKKLCIEAGEAVWIVNIDFYPLNADGNLFDAGTLAAMAALKTAKMPTYDKETKILNRENMKNAVPMDCTVVASTFAKIGDKMVVDPTMHEEYASVARLTVGIRDGNIVALQKGGNGGLTSEQIDDALTRAIKHSKNLLKHIK
ncbi:MAG: exosome complex protein Rrp42 [Candidatus Altiarchaeota archaeon]|nr:exosome complex protein Rrp42 [Candidatus Altiarchaeota archaeon]